MSKNATIDEFDLFAGLLPTNTAEAINATESADSTSFDTELSSEMPEQPLEIPADAPSQAVTTRTSPAQPYQADFRQLLLAFWSAAGFDGLGVNVPTRISKCQADIGAFRSDIGSLRLRYASCTAVTKVFSDRHECIPDCASNRQVAEELQRLNIEREELEKELRNTEPSLRCRDELYQEVQSYDYRQTKRPDYHRLLRRLDKLQHNLFQGSILERLRRSRSADYLFVALPEGELQPEELLDGWGLLYYTTDGQIKIAKKAQRQNCPVANRLHFALNIGRSATQAVMFQHGVQKHPDGRITLTKAPRRRRLQGLEFAGDEAELS